MNKQKNEYFELFRDTLKRTKEAFDEKEKEKQLKRQEIFDVLNSLKIQIGYLMGNSDFLKITTSETGDEVSLFFNDEDRKGVCFELDVASFEDGKDSLMFDAFGLNIRTHYFSDKFNKDMMIDKIIELCSSPSFVKKLLTYGNFNFSKEKDEYIVNEDPFYFKLIESYHNLPRLNYIYQTWHDELTEANKKFLSGYADIDRSHDLILFNSRNSTALLYKKGNYLLSIEDVLAQNCDLLTIPENNVVDFIRNIIENSLYELDVEIPQFFDEEKCSNLEKPDDYYSMIFYNMVKNYTSNILKRYSETFSLIKTSLDEVFDVESDIVLNKNSLELCLNGIVLLSVEVNSMTAKFCCEDYQTEIYENYKGGTFDDVSLKWLSSFDLSQKIQKAKELHIKKQLV